MDPKMDRVLSPSEVELITDAIADVLRELEEEPLAEYISQRVIDKLTSALEILS